MLYIPNKPHKLTRKDTRRAAFTLMELLVVVAILVVLAAVAVPSYFTYVEYSRRQAARTSAQTIGNAVKAYQAATGEWPQNLQQLTQRNNTGIGPTLKAEDLIDPWGRPYNYMPPPSTHNGETGPDISAQCPDGTTVGNWREK